MQPDVADRSKKSLAASVWAGFMIAVLAAASVVPILVTVYKADIEWAEDPGSVLLPLAFLIPFILLGVLAVWSAKRVRGIPVVTLASLLVVGAACYGYWIVATDESSTAGLIFLVIIPVQWVTAVGAGIIVVAFPPRIRSR